MQHDDINHCTAENVQEKKAKDAVHSATGKQAKVCFTKKPVIHWQKYIILTKNVMYCQNMYSFFA